MPSHRNPSAECPPPPTIGSQTFARARRLGRWRAICLVVFALTGCASPFSRTSIFSEVEGQADIQGHLAPPSIEPITEDQPQGASPHLLVRIPDPFESPDGHLYVEPDVQFVDGVPSDFASAAMLGTPPAHSSQGIESVESGGWLDRLQPTLMGLSAWAAMGKAFAGYPAGCDGGCYSEGAEPIFGDVLAGGDGSACHRCRAQFVIFNPANRSGDIGIGRERLAFAPFEMDSSQPSNNTLFRFDAAYGFPFPDRAEYLWAKPGKGPTAETEINYQDLRFRTEMGGESFSAITEISLRSLDPVTIENTTGMGDMNVATKVVMLDGKSWQLTQITRTYLTTGAASKGLGTGHVSLEPGVLATYRWRPTTFIHQELKYWFPLGGDPEHSGQVLRYGLGYSHLLYETDAFAMIHTCEFISFWFLDGAKGDPSTDIDVERAYQLYPGIRFVADTGGDFGLVEFGCAGTFSMGQQSLFSSFLRLDLRFSY